MLNDIGNGECLAGACHAQKYLGLVSVPKITDQLIDGFRLVAGRSVGRCQVELVHGQNYCLLKKKGGICVGANARKNKKRYVKTAEMSEKRKADTQRRRDFLRYFAFEKKKPNK